MKKLQNILFSTRLMSILIVVYFVAMAIATFVENDYGTQTSKALIYNAWWFELIMFLLTLNFIGNIFRYRLYRKEKWPVFLFHIAFIVILLGAFVTRYFGFEGMMPIREGQVSNTILTDKTYIKATVNDGKEQKDYEKAVLLGRLGNNHFAMHKNFRNKDFSIEYVDYIPNAKNTFILNEKGARYLKIVISVAKGREEVYLKDQNSTQVGQQLFTFNKPIQGAYNIIENENGLSFQAPFSGNTMVMKTQQTTPVYADSIANLQFLQLYSFPGIRFVVPGEPVEGNYQLASADKSEADRYAYDAVIVEVSSGGETKQIALTGTKNAIANASFTSINGLNFKLSYGSKEKETPFSIKLRDFQLERYPGSNSPSSYASEVSVIAPGGNFDYRIYMNHVLDYKGYRFFQASYDKDEKGTVLSVNHDYWGTLITYLGYILMSLGMFFTLFWKGSRFTDLSKKLKKLSQSKGLALLIFVFLSTSIQAQDQISDSLPTVSRAHADKFGQLMIQDFGGRIKPVNTYALEILRKIYKKDTYKGLTAEQVLLNAQIDPFTWADKNIIHLMPNALGKKLAKSIKAVNSSMASAEAPLTGVYHDGVYLLSDQVNKAYRKKNMDRNATDKELINLDERINVWIQALNGSQLRLYPKIGDPNNKWHHGNDRQALTESDTMIIKMHQLYLSSLKQAVKTNDYTEADKYLQIISDYQKNVGAAVIPSAKKIDWEIKYNHWGIFKKLMFYYMLIGFVFLVLAFINLFNPESKTVRLLLKIFSVLTILGMIAHVFGLGLRWYISGHEPWSNGYEAVVFVAFVTTLAGLIFSHKKSKFTLAATVLFASFLLGIAHGSMMNPEITNLVPVLKSYWLMIHVAVITASYGFLGLGALLGFVVLLLYVLRTKANADKLNKTIDELTYINELTLTVGLFTLSIGTFLGGVWASESWGRYWSWDPKEVWSLISMMVYIFILHMRLVPGLRGKFAFNLASFWAIATLIMTFFGVNYYLSGMHSYAAGDPVPIPMWIYFALAFFVVFSIVSYWRYRKLKK